VASFAVGLLALFLRIREVLRSNIGLGRYTILTQFSSWIFSVSPCNGRDIMSN
jgi:hypothetical protein